MGENEERISFHETLTWEWIKKNFFWCWKCRDEKKKFNYQSNDFKRNMENFYIYFHLMLMGNNKRQIKFFMTNKFLVTILFTFVPSLLHLHSINKQLFVLRFLLWVAEKCWVNARSIFLVSHMSWKFFSI